MILSGLWSMAVRTYAVLGITLAPIFALGSYFVARNFAELFFAAGQLLIIVPLWRMWCYRLWAGHAVTCVGLVVCGYWLFHWKEFDVPAKYAVFTVALLPALFLTTGKRLWRHGF